MLLAESMKVSSSTTILGKPEFPLLVSEWVSEHLPCYGSNLQSALTWKYFQIELEYKEILFLDSFSVYVTLQDIDNPGLLIIKE